MRSRSTVSVLIGLIVLLASPLVIAHEGMSYDWENPQIIGRHKEAPHATLMPFADRDTAMRGDPTRSPWFKSLNGAWRFHWSPNPDERPADFYRQDFDVSGWNEIQVPVKSWLKVGT